MESKRFDVRRIAGIKGGTATSISTIESELPTYTHYINANPKLVYESCKELWGEHDWDWHWVALDVNVCIVTVYDSEKSVWLKLRWDHWA